MNYYEIGCSEYSEKSVEKASLLKISLVVRSRIEEGVRVCSDAVLLDF